MTTMTWSRGVGVAPLRMILTLGIMLMLLATFGCDRDPKVVIEKKPISEVRHAGFRQDIPAERRGNASFDKAVFTRDGEYLVTVGTIGAGHRVWDPRTGALLRTIPGLLDGQPDELPVVNGNHHRLIARLGSTTPSNPLAAGLSIWDLRDGTAVGFIPDTDLGRAFPAVITPGGDAVVFREHQIETWALDGSTQRLMIAVPEGLVLCGRGSVTSTTYTDKKCFELSPSGRWLAVMGWDPADRPRVVHPYLVDLERGTLSPPLLSPDVIGNGVYGFAFSSAERTLAIGVEKGMWLWNLGSTDDPADERRGLFLAGDHKRNQFLTPMAFTANDTRIVALGDQSLVSTFDTKTGALVGRVAPSFEEREGVLRVSNDGTRAVMYRFVSDILVVIDGATGTQRSYLCPYFCNSLHNPVELPFAVSPDGHRVASGGRQGAGLWDTDTDSLIAPLDDPSLPPHLLRN